ncbi:MAG: HAMP domain-containing protein [Clostridia bacterium]|nr:HAMP domain-containing protein [Clostridia bacterium]
MNNKKKEKRSFSIKAHIFSTILGLTAVMLTVLWVLQGVFLNSIFKLSKESDIRRATNLIADNIESEDISSLISQVAVEYDLCVKVYGMQQGSDLYDEHILNDCILHKLADEKRLFNSWYEKALENNGEYTETIPRDALRDYVYDEEDFEGDVPTVDGTPDCVLSMRILTDSEGNAYLLILNASVVPMKSTIRTIRLILVLFTAVIVLISVLISYLMSRQLSAPIQKITKSAGELKNGDYNVRFDEDGPTEVIELAKTLNVTAVELENADRIQKELIANISHDLRTPLTMISGYSEFMRDFPSEITPENFQVIIDETARLNSLVNDLLDVSKLQSGTQSISIQKISLTKTIESTVARYSSLTSHTEYKISFIHEGEVFVMADETRLLQVVYNLINNAINYTGEDKTVTVRQDVLDDVVRISIIDTGEGISEENLPLIWDRYYKVDKVHKRAILGTGLGLSIVKNILLLHNSRFGVSSEPGKGSTFWFEFKIV